MRLQVQQVIEPGARDLGAWGSTPNGNAVLVVVVGGNRVLVEMTPEEAREIGVGGCYVSTGLMMARAQAAGATPPASMLVDAGGIPINGAKK